MIRLSPTNSIKFLFKLNQTTLLQYFFIFLEKKMSSESRLHFNKILHLQHREIELNCLYLENSQEITESDFEAEFNHLKQLASYQNSITAPNGHLLNTVTYWDNMQTILNSSILILCLIFKN